MLGNWNASHCLFSELTKLTSSLPQAAVTAHPLEVEVSRCGMCQFVRYFLLTQVRMWNDLPYAVFATGTLDGFKGAVG